MKMLYFYNEENGELFCSQAFSGGEIPENATLETPPKVKENETPIFKNGEWVILKDYRFTHKMINANNEIEFITEIGDIAKDCMLITNQEAEEIEEQQRIDKLTMTALDFINTIKQFGLTDEQIEDYLNANLSIKHQLQFCQNVYCGVAKSIMPISFGEITITAEMVENAFRLKHKEL